jgi:hypothetical protein
VKKVLANAMIYARQLDQAYVPLTAAGTVPPRKPLRRHRQMNGRWTAAGSWSAGGAASSVAAGLPAARVPGTSSSRFRRRRERARAAACCRRRTVEADVGDGQRSPTSAGRRRARQPVGILNEPADRISEAHVGSGEPHRRL